MAKKLIEVREKTIRERIAEEEDIFDRGEATRKQIILYIFTDFIRVSLILIYIVFDIFLLTEVWYALPSIRVAMESVTLFYGGKNLFLLYYIILALFVGFVLSWYEFKFYRYVRRKIKSITTVD